VVVVVVEVKRGSSLRTGVVVDKYRLWKWVGRHREHSDGALKKNRRYYKNIYFLFVKHLFFYSYE
jgi:hypothetical protein